MKNNKPLFGKWNFDKDNRNKFPKNIQEHQFYELNNNKYVIEATEYVNIHFYNNYGLNDNFIYRNIESCYLLINQINNQFFSNDIIACHNFLFFQFL